MRFERILWRNTMHEWVMNIHHQTWITLAIHKHKPNPPWNNGACVIMLWNTADDNSTLDQVWLGAIRQQAIGWVNVDIDRCCFTRPHRVKYSLLLCTATWWYPDMEKLAALSALYECNPPVTGFPSQKHVINVTMYPFLLPLSCWSNRVAVELRCHRTHVMSLRLACSLAWCVRSSLTLEMVSMAFIQTGISLSQLSPNLHPLTWWFRLRSRIQLPPSPNPSYQLAFSQSEGKIPFLHLHWNGNVIILM